MNTGSPDPILLPFKGLRYSPKKIGDLSAVVAPPYDVINPDLQSRLYEQHPNNVIRLILGKEEPSDHEKNNRYTRAAQALKKWVAEGVLTQDPNPAIYLYEQEFVPVEGVGKSLRRRGFIALRRLEPFGGKIFAHERTLDAPKQDRLNLLRHCQANLSPVFAVYHDPERRVAAVLNPFFEQQPLLDILGDSVRHRLWVLEDAPTHRRLNEILTEKKLVIADGHHRYETALAYSEERGVAASETAPYRYVMIYFAEMGDPGLIILPTHRLILGLKKSDPGLILTCLKEQGQVESYGAPHRSDFFKALASLHAERKIGFGLAFSGEGRYHLYSWMDQKRELLPVIHLHQVLLKKILGWSDDDEKNPSRIEYLRESDLLFRRLETERNSMAVFLNPPDPLDLAAAVERGIILPPKSTYFYPKLLSGLVFHPFKAI